MAAAWPDGAQEPAVFGENTEIERLEPHLERLRDAAVRFEIIDWSVLRTG